MSAALGELLAGLRAYLLAAADREIDAELVAKVSPSDVVQETFLWLSRISPPSRARPRRNCGLAAKDFAKPLPRLRDAFCGTGKRQTGREVQLDAADSKFDGPLAVLDDGHSTPSAHVVGEEDATRLLAALNLLPEEHRQVVWLRNWEGLSFDEVGHRTGRTAEAARKVFFRAVQRLSALLVQVDGKKCSSGQA